MLRSRSWEILEKPELESEILERSELESDILPPTPQPRFKQQSLTQIQIQDNHIAIGFTFELVRHSVTSSTCKKNVHGKRDLSRETDRSRNKQALQHYMQPRLWRNTKRSICTTCI